MKQDYKKMMSILLVSVLFTQTASPVLASLINHEESIYSEIAIVEVVDSLPKHKQAELDELIQELNLSKEETDFINQQYIDNHSQVQSRAKIGIVMKVVKVAKPILQKQPKCLV